jgi:hypothetical protein
MNSFTTVTLLPTTVYGSASGNYDGSSQDFYGNSLPAANYYAGQGNLQTIAYRLVDFVGIATVQATLQNDTSQARWFDIDTYGDGSSMVTEYHPVSVVGNFAHLRVNVRQFDSGTITVTAAY